ncbi:hypothetical protein QRD43_21160 [Pelomonas sp. APW6]|uniref:Uncharacterized protein n=1 Tax=Roseateles subflavus TaxID=3053353 RepID=A0ABT7LNI0_9BURK|nr:hypothetical protein [Pelomonas sp. APW6]MDL5034426.1 hypothetical protein [Pelomonas sp. APW6]
METTMNMDTPDPAGDATCPIKQAETNLAAARAAVLSELEQDAMRSEGSGAQERRREEHMQRLRDEEYRCERALEAVKRSKGVD